MARKLDAQQLEEFSAFLRTLFELARFPSDAEWARQSGVHAVNLSNARTGQGQLDGFNLLRLIRAAADRVEMPAEVLAILTARLEAGLSNPNAEILRRLSELEALTGEAVVRLATGESPEAEQRRREAGESP